MEASLEDVCPSSARSFVRLSARIICVYSKLSASRYDRSAFYAKKKKENSRKFPQTVVVLLIVYMQSCGYVVVDVVLLLFLLLFYFFCYEMYDVIIKVMPCKQHSR